MKLIPKLTEIQAERFWSRVQVQGPADCWEWTGDIRVKYGRLSLWSVHYSVHRIAYFLSTGIDPKSNHVCHTCDNPTCCNPAHLWLGTTQNNTQDKVDKGRCANNKGTKNPAVKLTEAKVRRIRIEFSKGMNQCALGRKYGVTHQMIHRIVKRKNWIHI